MTEETQDSREARERQDAYKAKVKRVHPSKIFGGRMAMLTSRAWPAYRTGSAPRARTFRPRRQHRAPTRLRILTFPTIPKALSTKSKADMARASYSQCELCGEDNMDDDDEICSPCKARLWAENEYEQAEDCMRGGAYEGAADTYDTASSFNAFQLRGDFIPRDWWLNRGVAMLRSG